MAEHAQQWADYLAQNYTQADAKNGASPHASQYKSSTHGLPYKGEGENIAWASAGLEYVLDEPVDISKEGSAGNINGKYGAVDMWGKMRKAYYVYEGKTSRGHGKITSRDTYYFQLVWAKKVTKGWIGWKRPGIPKDQD